MTAIYAKTAIKNPLSAELLITLYNRERIGYNYNEEICCCG
jgi:hypothetical protein